MSKQIRYLSLIYVCRQVIHVFVKMNIKCLVAIVPVLAQYWGRKIFIVMAINFVKHFYINYIMSYTLYITFTVVSPLEK